MAVIKTRVGGDIATPFPPNGIAVTKSDSDVFESPVAIYCGTGGTVTVKPANPNLPNVAVVVPSGGFVPFLVTKVMSAGTDAADMIAVF